MSAPMKGSNGGGGALPIHCYGGRVGGRFQTLWGVAGGMVSHVEEGFSMVC